MTTIVSRQLVRFAAVGLVGLVAYLLLYAALRPVMPAQPANVIAMLVTAVANTTANRRLTFGVRGRENAARHQVQGLVVFAIGLAVTSTSIVLTDLAVPHPTRLTELTMLVAAQGTATVLRFLLMKSWVFAPAATPAPAPGTVHIAPATREYTGV
jgi:putative flippase GtrA